MKDIAAETMETEDKVPAGKGDRYFVVMLAVLNQDR